LLFFLSLLTLSKKDLWYSSCGQLISVLRHGHCHLLRYSLSDRKTCSSFCEELNVIIYVVELICLFQMFSAGVIETILHQSSNVTSVYILKIAINISTQATHIIKIDSWILSDPIGSDSWVKLHPIVLIK